MFKIKSLLIAMALVSITALPSLAEDTPTPSAFAAVTDNYLSIQTSLAADSMDGVKDHALAIAEQAKSLELKFDFQSAGVLEKDAEACAKLIPGLSQGATTLAAAQDLKAARAAFGELSENLVTFRNLIPGEGKPSVAYCPMAKHSWLQTGQQISNPYYGSKMLRCGSIVNK